MTNQINHVDHGGVSCNEHQECHLNGVISLDVTRYKLEEKVCQY